MLISPVRLFRGASLAIEYVLGCAVLFTLTASGVDIAARPRRFRATGCVLPLAEGSQPIAGD